MQFALRASSQGRSWAGFDANLYDTSGGLVEVPSAPVHRVSMHVSRPVVATCRCDGPIQRRLQSPGDVDFVPLGYAAAWEDEGPATVLSMRLSQSLMRETAESMGLDADRILFIPNLEIRDPRMEHIGWALTATLEADEPDDRLYAESLGSALAVELIRRHARALREVPKRGLTRRQLREVVDYIDEHLSAELSLAELAGVTGVSASHFKALFKQSVGTPVHQYVIQRRVRYAAGLLSRGSLKLSEVALQAGFADQSHMARCMRRVMGMTPSTFLYQCK
jgi:AraC family transcriptional regulator